LLALNTLCGEPYTEAELCTLGASLGADIPFCIRGLQGAQTATGIGEIMMPAPGIRPEVTLLVVLPGTAVSTPAAFRLLDELYGARDAAEREAENRTRYERHLDALQGGVLAELEMTSWNRFEEAVFALQPTTRQVFELVRSLGAPMTRMSGSGPTVVGYFDSTEMALAAQKTLMDAGYAAYLCHPLGDA
jgi:4-diphosphocytidyl-2-C-methyl-D-erythritol kinase